MKSQSAWEKKLVWIIAVQVVTYVVLVTRNAVISNTLSIELFGEFFYVLSLSNILLMVYTFGWPSLLVREISTSKDFKGTFYKNIPIAISECIVIFVLFMVAFVVLGGIFQFASTLYGASYVAIFASIAILLFSVYEGNRRVFFSKIVSGICIPLLYVAAIIVFSDISDLNKMLFLYCFVYSVVIVGVTTHLVLSEGIDLKKTFNSKVVAGLFAPSRISLNSWLILASFSNLVLVSTDAVMLKHLSNDSELGGYGLVASVVGVVSLGIVAANSLYGPETGKLYREKNWSGARNLFRKTQFVILVWSALGLFVLIIFSKNIYRLTSGQSDLSFFPLSMIILGIGQFVNAITGPVATALFMYGKTTIFSISVFVACIVNIIGNYVLIGEFGALGAAISTSITIASLNVVQYWIARQFELV